MGHTPATRRRRYNYRRIAILAVAAVAMLAWIVSPLWATSTDRTDGAIRVTVQHGDTIWRLATTHGPDSADPRRTVSRIVRLNHLPNATIRPGDTLLIPAR